MYYFAYGSNMSSKRLTKRIDATKVGIGKLIGYQLRFHKVSKDGTGKCDSYYTNNNNDYVLGVVYEIAENDKKNLDRVEGVGHGYESKKVNIEIEGKTIQAVTYVANKINENLQPFDWYKEHVLYGARENDLNQIYIEKIENIPAITDKDVKRKNNELSIYE